MADLSAYGFTIGIGLDNKAFNKGITSVNAGIRSATRESRELEKSLMIKWDTKQFEQAQKKAQEAISLTEFKAKALQERLTYLEKERGDTTSAHFMKIRDDLIKTNAQVVVLQENFERLEKLKFEKLKKDLTDIGNKTMEIGKALAPLSAASAGALAGLGKLGKEAVEFGRDVELAAKQVNLNVEQLQKWRYVADQVKLSQFDLKNALERAQLQLGRLAVGEVATGLEKLGFTAKEAARGMEHNFEEIILRLSKVKNATEQAGLANEIFGIKAGSTVLPLLKEGGAGINALTQEFEAFGFISEEQIQKLDNFDTVMRKLKYQFGLLKTEIGQAMLPVMEVLATILQEKIIPIFRNLSEWLNSLSDTQVKWLTGILAITASLAPFLLVLGKLTKLVPTLLNGMKLLNSGLLKLAANPVVLTIVVIVGLLALMYARSEKFRESINNLLSVLGGALMDTFNVLVDLIQSVLAPILELVSNLIEVFAEQLSIIINVATEVLKPFLKLVSVFQRISAFYSKFMLLINPFMLLVKVFNNHLMPVIRNVYEWINDKIIGGLRSGLESVVNWAINGLNKLIRAANTVLDVVGLGIKEIDNITIGGKVEVDDEVEVKKPKSDKAEDFITDISPDLYPSTYINNDYSDKVVNIEVVVQNYAEKVDIDEMVREINIKLAGAM